MRVIFVVVLASAGSVALATVATGQDNGNCCCKKDVCDPKHKHDRSWFQHVIEEEDSGNGETTTWCCKKLDTKCGGSMFSWSGYKKPALEVSDTLALCTFGTGGDLAGISCPAHASYDASGECVCDKGYEPEGEGGSLSYAWATSSWKGQCVKVECPSNAENHPHCSCPNGFSGKVAWRGHVGEHYYEGRCYEAACPANARKQRTERGMRCTCKQGYRSQTGLVWMKDRRGKRGWQGTCEPVECPKSFDRLLETAVPTSTVWGQECACVENTAAFENGRHTGESVLPWSDRMKRHVGTCEPFACGLNMGRKAPLEDCACRKGYYTPPRYSPPTWTIRGWQGFCARKPPERPKPTERRGERPRSQTRNARHGERPRSQTRHESRRDHQRTREPSPGEDSASFRAHNTRFRQETQRDQAAPDPKPKQPDPKPKPSRSCGGGFFDFFNNWFGGDDAEADQPDTPEPEPKPPPQEKRREEPRARREQPRRQNTTRREPLPSQEPPPPKPVLPAQPRSPPPGASRARRANQDVCNTCKAVYEWLPPHGTKAINEHTTKQRLKMNYRKGALLIHPDKLGGDPHKDIKTEWFKTLSACYDDLKTVHGSHSKDFVECCGLHASSECRF